MSNYKPINDKGDFIERDCLFDVDGELYSYSGVIHDRNTVYGVKICGADNSEHSFLFDQVNIIYKSHNPNP